MTLPYVEGEQVFVNVPNDPNGEYWLGTVTGASATGEIFVSPDDFPGTDQRVSVEFVQRTRDRVKRPSHYDLPGGIQVIDLLKDESFLRGNIIKYVMRAPHKGNELEDMKKSREYITWEIERLENE